MKIKTLLITASLVVFSCSVAGAQAAAEPAVEPTGAGQAVHPAALSLPGIVIDEVMAPEIGPAPAPQALLEAKPPRRTSLPGSSHS